VNKVVPYEPVTLQCHSSGLPDPSVSNWSKGNSNVTANSGELKIRSFTPETVGKYTCHVTNNVTSSSCSFEIRGKRLEAATNWKCSLSQECILLMNITYHSNGCNNLLVFFPGSMPKVDCKVTRFVLSCNVSGYPRPKIVLQVGMKRLTGRTEVVIMKHSAYQFIAYNAFGTDSDGVYKCKISAGLSCAKTKLCVISHAHQLL
jgi:hypothetical protein